MEKEFYRKKSLENISSPEALHDYMRVTSPRLWMLLAAISALLVGFMIYASTKKMENTLPFTVHVENCADGGRQVSAELPLGEKDVVDAGMPVRIGSENGRIESITSYAGKGKMSLVIELDNKDADLQDGAHDAEIIVESTSLTSFLWNK